LNVISALDRRAVAQPLEILTIALAKKRIILANKILFILTITNLCTHGAKSEPPTPPFLYVIYFLNYDVPSKQTHFFLKSEIT
jgi:hypothetical protein